MYGILKNQKAMIKLIDEKLDLELWKEINHNKTIGLLIVKENDKYIIKYTTSNDILVTTYALN